MQLENFIEIDGIPVKIEGERNLLEVISKSGVKLPVFCYHSDLSIYGACRMCMVEDEKGQDDGGVFDSSASRNDNQD